MHCSLTYKGIRVLGFRSARMRDQASADSRMDLVFGLTSTGALPEREGAGHAGSVWKTGGMVWKPSKLKFSPG